MSFLILMGDFIADDITVRYFAVINEDALITVKWNEVLIHEGEEGVGGYNPQGRKET